MLYFLFSQATPTRFHRTFTGSLVPDQPPAQVRLMTIDKARHYVYALDAGALALVEQGDCIFQLASERRPLV